MPAPFAAQPMPYRWERVEAGLGEWAGWGLQLPGEAVLWAGHRVDRPALPYLSLEKISGPTARGLALKRRRWPAPASALVTVALPAVGGAVRFRVDGWRVEHVRAPGEQLADVRDALIERCDRAMHLAGWTAAPAGGAGISIVPDAPGDFAEVAPLIGCTAAPTVQWCERIEQVYTSRIRVACLGAREQSPAAWIVALRLAQDSDAGAAILRRYGLSFGSRAVDVDPRDVNAPPEVEEVAAMDVFVQWLGHRTTPLGPPLAGAVLSGASALLDGSPDPSIGLDLATA